MTASPCLLQPTAILQLVRPFRLRICRRSRMCCESALSMEQGLRDRLEQPSYSYSPASSHLGFHLLLFQPCFARTHPTPNARVLYARAPIRCDEGRKST